MSHGFTVHSLGEVAIRCADMGKMLAFYRDVVGLALLSGDADSDIVFFKIAEGYRGHTTVLALFAHHLGRPGVHPASADAPKTGAASSLHHIALGVDFEAQDAAVAWYREHGLDPRVEQFDWIGWRGVFVTDPEGNTVELVARDPNWTARKSA
ncbi:MAG: VOC family protein [Pseudomonadota bacterium]